MKLKFLLSAMLLGFSFSVGAMEKATSDSQVTAEKQHIEDSSSNVASREWGVTRRISVLAFFSFLTFVVLVSAAAKVLLQRQRNELVRHMVEKGQSPSPELLFPSVKRPTSDLKLGLALLTGGIGISIFFWVKQSDNWALGVIPGLIGVGLLVAWLVEREKK